MQIIKPDWPAPPNVKAYTTIKNFDMAELTNRQQLITMLSLPEDPIWLRQVHGAVALSAAPENREKDADASYTATKNRVCVVLTADCLPILLCHQAGTHVAAIHAGWRGLERGVIAATVTALTIPSSQLLAWLGPAIGPKHFEVGNEVRDAFLRLDEANTAAFSPSPNKRWLADLYVLAKRQLMNLGIQYIYGGEFCTYSDPKRFYSYRREGEKTGRMASLIWIE